MRSLTATELREQCLQLLDQLPSDGILITKRGQAVARLMPVQVPCADLIGSVPGLVVDPEDDLLCTGLRWDAEP